MSVKKNLPKLLPVDLYDLTEGDKERIRQEDSLGMVAPQDPILSRTAKQVDPKLIRTPLVQQVIRGLREAAGSQQLNSKRGKGHRMLVGLAAPQIGHSWRVIVVDTRVTPDRKHSGRLECLINPEIIWRSKETEEAREGCFSAGPVWGLVRRSVAIKIKALTPEGEKIERIFEDFTARIVQHEIDHLSGIRFPDRIKSDKKRHWVHAEELPLYPDLIHGWARICSRERWESFTDR